MPATVVRVFRQTIEFMMQRIKVSDYAEDHEKFKTVLTKLAGLVLSVMYAKGIYATLWMKWNK
jgi:hypothetical protein